MDPKAIQEAWESEQPELALRRLLPAAKRTGDPTVVLELMLQVARAQRPAKALETFNDVEFILVDSSLRGTPAEARYLEERARVFAALGWEAEAAEDVAAARSLVEGARESQDPGSPS